MPEADDCRTGVSKNIDGGMGWNTCIIKELKRSMRSQRCRVKRAFLFCKNMCMHICVYIYIYSIQVWTYLPVYLSIYLSFFLSIQLASYPSTRVCETQTNRKLLKGNHLWKYTNKSTFISSGVYVYTYVVLYVYIQFRKTDGQIKRLRTKYSLTADTYVNGQGQRQR